MKESSSFNYLRFGFLKKKTNRFDHARMMNQRLIIKFIFTCCVTYDISLITFPKFVH